MAEMIKFYKGLASQLPAAGASNGLYITTDEGGIYLGTGTGMKRLGDFVQVANVAALPEKAHESCLYYCVAENILAKWNGTEWKQINKQPTAEEMKTLLGLGTLAYKSEVAEDDLNAALKEKVNASAEANHTHANKGVIDGITAEKVAAWDAAEGNAKTYADGLDTAMDARVKAVEGTSHTHTNKALLDTYTQTEADLADAVAKKHEHANKAELDKIASGDKAKWDAVVADHLVGADKTALEDAIGDVNTALGEEVTRAKAAEKANADAITAIKDGTIVDSFADVEGELAKKVDKVDGKSLVLDTEITKLAGVSEGANKVENSETNGSIKIDGVETVVYTHPDKHTVSEISDFDTAVKAYDYATKAEAKGYADAKDDAIANALKAGNDAASALNTHIGEAEAKYETKTDAGNKLTEAKGYTDTEVAKVQGEVDDLEAYVGTIPATYTEETVIDYINKKASETLAAAQGGSSETAASVLQALNDYKALNDPKVQANIDAIDAIEADYLKAADKQELSGLITAEKERAEVAEAKALKDAKDYADAEIDGLTISIEKKENVEYIIVKNKAGTEVASVDATAFVKDGMLTNAVYSTETKKLTLTWNTDAGIAATDIDLNDLIDTYTGGNGINVGTDGVISIDESVVATVTELNKVKATAEDAQTAQEVSDAIDAKITALDLANTYDAKGAASTALGEAKTYADGKAEDAQAAAEATAAGALASAKTELEGKITSGDSATLASAKADSAEKVQALANGAVKTNADNIATLIEAMTWGSFAE